MRTPRSAALLLAAALLASACGRDGDTTAASGADESAETSVPATTAGGDDDGCSPEATEEVAPEVSEQWDIDYHDGYKVLTISDSEAPDGPELTYVLVQCGAPEPELEGDLADAPRFEVPIRRTAITHANGLAMLDELGVADTVVAMSGALLARADDPWYGRLIEAAGDPVDLGDDGIDTEAALGAEPDLLVMAGFGPGYTEVADAAARGLPAVMISNRIEPEPLGSAEWVKVLAAFYNAEAEGNRVFDEIEAGFRDVLDEVEGRAPEGFEAGYLCLDPDRGCELVYAHGAETLNGRILEALGVENPFAEGNDAGNGMTFDYEQALDRGVEADAYVVYYEESVNEAAIAADPRLQELRALADGAYVTQRDETYPECGATLYVRVDVLIRDFAVGLFPDAFPGEEGTCFVRAGGQS